MFIQNTQIEIIKSSKFNTILDSDLYYSSLNNLDRLQIINFKTNIPHIAFGSNQKIKHIKNILTIKRLTGGSLVYISGSDIVLTFLFPKKLFKVLPITTTIQINILKLIQQYFKNKYNINIILTTSNSYHQYKPIACFNAITKNELVYNNRKFAGVSFTRYKDYILGHILIYKEPTYVKLADLNLLELNNVYPISINEILNEFNEQDFLTYISTRIINE